MGPKLDKDATPEQMNSYYQQDTYVPTTSYLIYHFTSYY